MSSVARASIPLHVSPSVRKALGELATLLRDYHYSEHAVGRIVAHTAREGTPTGCPELDREDEQDASEVFVAELEPVGLDSPAWDVDAGAVYLDVDLIVRGEHPFPIDPDADDTGEFPPSPLEAIAAALPPVAGGSPEAERYEPTPEDLADLARWSEDLERRRNAAEGRSGAHDAATLERIHRALYGRSEPFHA
jgi:hypothetical protein